MRYIILTVREEGIFPVLDYSAKHRGDRFPLKVFTNKQNAEAFSRIQRLDGFQIVPLPSFRIKLPPSTDA